MHELSTHSGIETIDGPSHGTSVVPQSARPAAVVPAIIAYAGEDAVTRFAEFFTANIRNPHTRRAYFRNAVAFLRWCEGKGARELKAIRPMLVAAYIEQLQKTHSRPSVKQQLATIRMLFDWLVTGQVMSVNPAHAVRGPRHVVAQGKTPVLNAEETRALLDSIATERVAAVAQDGTEIREPDVVGLRDRALIAAMFFTFARVGAVVAMTVEDYFQQGKRSWLRLHEKGGKEHLMPAHHTLEGYIDAYIEATGLAADPKGPLFRSAPRTAGVLTGNPLSTADVWRMIRRRAVSANIRTRIGCHSFRATGITNYLQHKGTLEKAQQMASHASPRTTKLYDRTSDQITLDEVEKIQI
jgi:site-specific recombinase XerD